MPLGCCVGRWGDPLQSYTERPYACSVISIVTDKSVYDMKPRANHSKYSDSVWAVKHSISGYSFHLGSATISWASKKQTTVASSCEAEIMAGSEAAKEAIYLSGFLKELGSNVHEPPPLKMDNKSAIDLSYNPEHHSKTKHIERRHYFIRECVEDGKLRVPFVPSHENVADFFTKPLMWVSSSLPSGIK